MASRPRNRHRELLGRGGGRRPSPVKAEQVQICVVVSSRIAQWLDSQAARNQRRRADEVRAAIEARMRGPIGGNEA